jgi:anti-sigma B factor antagonist
MDNLLREKDLDSQTKLLTLEMTRLDSIGTSALKRHAISLFEAGQDSLVVDLHAVEFIDSSGLGILISLLKQVGTRGRLVICNLQPNVLNTFKLSRMDRVFSIQKSVDEAFESLER